MSLNDRPNEQFEGNERPTQGNASLSNAAFAEMRIQSAAGGAQLPGEANLTGLNFGNPAQLYGNEGLNYGNNSLANYENAWGGTAQNGMQWQNPGFFPANYEQGAYEQLGQSGQNGNAGHGGQSDGHGRKDNEEREEHERHHGGHRRGHHGHGRGHHHNAENIDPITGLPISASQTMQPEIPGYAGIPGYSGYAGIPGYSGYAGIPGYSGDAGGMAYMPGYASGNPMQWGLGDGTSSLYSPGSMTAGTTSGDSSIPSTGSAPTDNTTSNGSSGGSASDANNLSNLANATYKITAIDNSTTGDYGTGFAATLNGGKNDGLIVTDEHVVQGAQSITLTGSDGQTYTAKVVKDDAANDLAILQIQGASPNSAAINVDSNASGLGSGTVETAGHAQGEANLTTGTGTIDGSTTYGNANFADSTVQQNPNRTLLQIANLGTEGGQSGSAIIDQQTGQLIGNVEAGNGNGKTPSSLTLANTSSEIAADLAAAQTAVG